MKNLFTYIFFCLPFLLLGQDKTYKEIKSLEQTKACRSGDKLVINGERTFLKLRSWDKDLVQLNVQVISKHQNQSQALSDLEKIAVVFEKKGKQITYSNSIKINNPKDKPKSNLKVILELIVPEYLELDISNKFGQIDIQGNYKKISSNSQFTTLTIDGLDSNMSIGTEYGDATIENCTGTLNINSDRSNLTLKDINSQTEIDIKYGELEMYVANNKETQIIEAVFSPIIIHLPSPYKQELVLDCDECKIESNNDNYFSEKKIADDSQSATKKGASGQLKIESKIEDIKIKFQNKQANSN